MPAADTQFLIGMGTLVDLRAYQFRAVRRHGTPTNDVPYPVDKVAAVANPPAGILQNKPKANQAARIAVSGECFAEANGAVTAGSPITFAVAGGHEGRVEAVGLLDDGSAPANRWIMGVAMEAATAAGDIIRVRLHSPMFVGQN